MMCLSVVASNESVVEPETPLMGVDLLPVMDHDDDDMDNSFGKRRKMSKTDSPNSSCFDVARLLDSIHREVEGEEYACSSLVSDQNLLAKSTESSASTDKASVSFACDDFDFIDIPETPASKPEPPVLKRCSLGKRSRGLGRSQTIKTGLCALGETE